jgi:uncharacterized membrane protein SpoIIM required for sporulation
LQKERKLKKGGKIKAQITIEFIMIIAIYLSFILIVIHSQKDFYDKISNELRVLSRASDSYHLSFIFSLINVNNPKTDYIATGNCIITREYVICGNYSTKKFSENYEEEIV